MDHLNSPPSNYVNNPASTSHQHNVDNFFASTDDVNGFDLVNAVDGVGSYAQGWEDPGTSINASNPHWSNSASSHLQSSFNQGSNLATPATTDRATFYNGGGVGGNDHFGDQGLPSAISPTTLTNHTQFNAFSNLAQATTQANTIAPEALQSRPVTKDPSNQNVQPAQGHSSKTGSEPAKLPKGTASGNFLITSLDSLKQLTNARSLDRFVDVAVDAVDLPISGSNIPAYVPRKSRNEVKRMLGSNQGYTAIVNKKLVTGSGPAKSVSVPTYVNASGKLSTKPGKLEQTSSEGSSEESEYESSDEGPELPPIPTVRPTTPQAAVRYDAIKACWRPKTTPVTTESIRTGLTRFWEVLQTIRDRWKSDLANVTAAVEAKKDDEVPLLKGRVKTQRDLIEVALKAAMQHGHPDVLDNFGQVAPAMLAFASLLQDRIKDTDYNGSFSRAMLEFLGRCKLLDNAVLEKSQIARMLQRFSKRGDDEIKALSKVVTTNANAASKKSKEAKTAPPTSTSTAASKPSTETARKTSVSTTSGTKRPLASDGVSEQPTKKVAGADNDNVAKATKPGVVSPNSKTAVGAKALVKPRTHSVTPKPSSFVASLQAGKKAAAPATVTKPTIIKPAPAQRATAQAEGAPAFSFASVLADVAKPKESKPVEVERENVRTNETAVGRAKRLRKEARRKLHVTFKPESKLVDIRYFTHDPDEELGHDASQTRDVGDTRSEGKMLKMQSHMMEVDEDDGVDSIQALFSREWREPKLVDFSVLSDDIQQQNYVPHGGGLQLPDMPDKAIQQDREASTLAVFYSNPSDIPLNPKDPPANVMDDAPEVMEFGQVPEQVLKRIEEVKKKAAEVPLVQPEIMSLLSSLQNNPTLLQQQQQYPAAANMMGALPQIPAPFNQSIPRPPQPPNVGLPPNRGGSAPNINTIMSAMGQRPSGFPSVANVENGNSPTSGSAQDLTAILAALQSNNTLQQQQPAAVPLNMAGMPFMPNIGQMPLTGQPNMAPTMGSSAGQAPFENEERRRWRMQDSGNDDNAGIKQNEQKKGSREGGSLPYRVRPCTYWLQGKCNKGDRCTFLHSET